MPRRPVSAVATARAGGRLLRVAIGMGVLCAAALAVGVIGSSQLLAPRPEVQADAAAAASAGGPARPGAGAASHETEAAALAPPKPSAADTGISALAAAAWLSETATRYSIPERALAAYAGAAMRLAGEQPECGVDWATLAGIGQVESAHGTLHGGGIGPDGMQTPALVGIALDGSSTLALRDTDGGALDGDAVWDRAVGPMQIIPQTWQQYAADGNGDGELDPQHIDDAVLTAARYLCAVGVDLRTTDGWIAAIDAYNPSIDYNNRVAAAADYYRSV